jgi:hypothetical protein
MSGASADEAAFAAQLWRDMAESQKRVAEMLKLGAEREKRLAEERRLSRDRMLAPVIALGGLVVGALGIAVGVLGLLLHAR